MFFLKKEDRPGRAPPQAARDSARWTSLHRLGELNPLGNSRGFCSWRVPGPLLTLSWLILAFKTPPRASKTPSRPSKTPPRASKTPPRPSKMGPRHPPRAPKIKNIAMFNNFFAFLGLFGAILALHGCKHDINCHQNALRMPRRASKMPPKPSKRPQAVSNNVKMPSPCQVLAKSLPNCKIRQRCLPTMVNHNGLLQRPCLSTKGGLAVVRPRGASSIMKDGFK